MEAPDWKSLIGTTHSGKSMIAYKLLKDGRKPMVVFDIEADYKFPNHAVFPVFKRVRQPGYHRARDAKRWWKRLLG